MMVEAFAGWPDLRDTDCRVCEREVDTRDRHILVFAGDVGWRLPATLAESKWVYRVHWDCWVRVLTERERARRMAGSR